ncbi:UNVERIFIED_CONTAM: Inositol polyphosphate multikinase beta [Sesamum radiatum]|uniref:Inositol polyphosphate multikinase beta n=1 Tax=Sesamum radiatum TaxID=300843 RepID=A0AAW2LEB4_SESRA
MVCEKELALEGKSPCPEIKLVDFAHVFEGRGVIDHNFLGGLCSLIKFISEILTTLEDSTSNVLVEDAHRSHVYPENGLA